MKTPSFGPIILMAAMYMNRGPALMNMHIIYVECVRCCQFERDILTKKKKRAIVCMAAIRYIGLIRLVPTYIQYVAIRNTCTKFHHTFKTERLVYPCIVQEEICSRKGQSLQHAEGSLSFRLFYTIEISSENIDF